MIDDNTKTIMAFDRIYESDDIYQDDIFNGTQYAMELDERNPVLEGVCKRLSIDENDIKAVTKELTKLYRAMGVEAGIPRVVRNWLVGERVNASSAYKANLFDLCIALGLDIGETKEFFLKNFMTIPFCYKNREDAIYYFGIKNRLEYGEIVKLINECSDIDETKSEKDTFYLGEYLSEIKSVDALREYLMTNTFSKSSQYNSIANEIENLIAINLQYARCEKLLKEELNREYINETNSISDLLYVIYGYDSQKKYAQKDNNISKCIFLPKSFRENFPNNQEFSRIKNRKASPDVYRKALIILKFYNFFCQELLVKSFGSDDIDEIKKSKHLPRTGDYYNREKSAIIGDMEDFYIETSELLEKCGFGQMYVRNPFDWLILYCANSADPLEAFRELIQERYVLVEQEAF